MRRALFAIALVLCGAALSSAPADALPTFAKAYGVPCSVCHTVPPQLNAYGRYIQRTGYGALSRDLLKNIVPVNFSEELTYDSQASYQPHQIQPGNVAIHAAGYLAPDVTFHIHQWILQNDQAGGVDTLQVAYSHLFKGNGAFFAGKLSALPVTSPFSNQSDIAPYTSAELQVGEHMYQEDMMRWGTAASYVRPNLFLQAGWLFSNGDLGGISDFSNNTDKTFEWIAAFADPGKPFEAGAYGSVGSWPLTEGGVDPYNSFSIYVERDPGPHFAPGILAIYQWAYDANPGLASATGGMTSDLARIGYLQGIGPPMPVPQPMATLPPAHSTAETFEIWEPFFDRGVYGLRYELTNDGLGNVIPSGNVDLSIQPFARYDYLHLYLESALAQDSKPAWRGGLWWILPLWPSNW
jgi:hypothetical protein